MLTLIRNELETSAYAKCKKPNIYIKIKKNYNRISYKFLKISRLIIWQYQRHLKNRTESTWKDVDISLIRDISKTLVLFLRFLAHSCVRKLPMVKYETKTSRRSLLYYLWISSDRFRIYCDKKRIYFLSIFFNIY